MTAHDWRAEANCRGLDPESFHPGRGDGAEMAAARAVCDGCDVRRECLDEALANAEPFGIWGGTSIKEREQLLGQRLTARTYREPSTTSAAQARARARVRAKEAS